jgi:hypothetical protein
MRNRSFRKDVSVIVFSRLWVPVMKFVRVLVASLLIFHLPVAATVEAQTNAGSASRNEAQSSSRSALLADCKETEVRPVALPPRPTVRRATFSSKPTRRHHARTPHKVRKAVRRKAVSRKHVARKHPRKHRASHAAPRRGRAPLRLRRVTYASPLCAQRSTTMNTMLGLPEYAISAPPEAAAPPVIENALLGQPPVLGVTGGSGPGGTFPGGPFFPIGPGPVIVFPGEPVTPIGPVTPPVTPGGVPEPASWATMIMGMFFIGRVMRRRKLAAAKTA